MNDTLKIGIIGTNFISDLFCEAAKKTGVEICAIYSRNENTANSFADKHSIEHRFCDFDAFAKSELINAVYVASPICCHYPQAKILLGSGKHVLCEKAITSNLSQLKELRAIATEKRLVLLEAMRPAFDPVYETIRENIAKCGKLRRAHFEFCQYSSRYDKFKNGIIENAFNPALSNAAVMDIGIYCIYLCTMYFGKPQSIISRSVKLCNGFEGQGEAILSYGDMTVNIVYSKISQSHSKSYILGENGQLLFGSALPKINSLCYSANDGTTEEIALPIVQNNMIYEIDAFSRFIKSGHGHEGYLDISEISMSIADEIRRQNRVMFPDDK